VRARGAGEPTFTRCDPDWGVGFDMLLDGRGRRAASTMSYADVGDGVQVTWEMVGDNGFNPLGRFAGLLMDMVVGPMFDEGLARLKLVAEEAPAAERADTGRAAPTADAAAGANGRLRGGRDAGGAGRPAG
jgi:hypothetical protein